MDGEAAWILVTVEALVSPTWSSGVGEVLQRCLTLWLLHSASLSHWCGQVDSQRGIITLGEAAHFSGGIP